MLQKLFDLSGRVVVVTGAARGLGRAIAHGLAAHGAHLVVGDLDEAGVRDVANAINATGGQAFAAHLDVTEADSCAALVSHALRRFGRLDVLVNNAAVDILEPVERLSNDSWRQVLDVNVSGVLFASQAAVRHWLAQRTPGSIVNISSIASVIGIPNLASYSAAKGGVNQLTRVMAVELAKAGIRVNAIAPGYLENVMQGATAAHAESEMEARIRTRTPLGRRARLEELVGPVVFLASDASSYVTGTILFVDGGYAAA